VIQIDLYTARTRKIMGMEVNKSSKAISETDTRRSHRGNGEADGQIDEPIVRRQP
jgi:hypothetical protein